MTTIDSSNTAAALAQQVLSIERESGGTDLGLGLEEAVDVLRTGSGTARLIVVATDISEDGLPDWLDLGTEIRTGTGYAAGLGQTRICTVFIDPGPCSEPPETTPNAFLRKLANTLDAPAPQPYLDQPVGLGDVHPADRLGPVRPPLEPRGEVPEVLLQRLAIGPPRLPVHAQCGLRLEAEVRLPKRVQVVDVVQERGDPAGSYADQKDLDGQPRVLLGSVDIGADEFWANCNCPLQDADRDSDVDLADFLSLSACFNGPNNPYA